MRRSKLPDRLLLVATGLVVSAAGVASGVLGEAYNVNPAWLFFAWNSILLVPIVGVDFRGQFRRPVFVIFFVAWMCIHGLVVLGLIRWVSILYWIPAILLELLVGYFALDRLLGILPPDSQDKPKVS